MHMLGYNAAPESLRCAEAVWIRRALASIAKDSQLPPLPPPGERVVILHDAQALGLAPALASQGYRILWRHHLGSEPTGCWSRVFWTSIRPLIERSVALSIVHDLAYVPHYIRGNVVAVTPGIDFSTAKNRPLSERLTWRQLPRAFADIIAVESTDSRPIEPTSKVALSMSRWAPLKDPVSALQLCAAAFESDHHGHLILVGPVPSDPSARKVLASVKSARDRLNAHIRDRIHIWTVRQPGTTRSDEFANHALTLAHAFIAMSQAEGFGLVVTEALFHRTPVLGRDVGGIARQIDLSKGGYTGKSHADLINPLIHLLANDCERQSMADRGRAAVKTYFAIERSVNALAKSLEKFEWAGRRPDGRVNLHSPLAAGGIG